jgi:hypothetical protein
VLAGVLQVVGDAPQLLDLAQCVLQGSARVSCIPPWLASGWGCRDRYLPEGEKRFAAFPSA